MRMPMLVLSLLIACDSGKKPAPSTPPANIRPLPQDAGVELDAWSASDPIDARVVAGTLVDAGAPDADAIQISWVVYPPSVPMKGQPDMLQQPVTLEVTHGGKTQATNLKPQFGALFPYNQPWCHSEPAQYPLEKGEVGKLVFYEGGAGGYTVKRKGDSVVVFSWAQTDGLCGTVDKPVECPRNEKLVATVPVKAKAGANVIERIIEIDEKGARKPFDCSAR